MNIIKPITALPVLTLEFTGEEAQAFMEFLYAKESSKGVFGDGIWLYSTLYNKGYRRPSDDS